MDVACVGCHGWGLGGGHGWGMGRGHLVLRYAIKIGNVKMTMRLNF